MVHPYLRRRDGLEPIETSTPEVDRVLSRTLGVPLFQEQAMQLAIVAAGFTPDEADQLRRAIAAWKTKSNVIFELGQRLVEGMVEHGLDRGFAERCFRQIQGFSEYGFPESHAASFALIVYASAWLKHHHPAAFAAALLNSQPMGFYAPAQIIQDAARHHVKVLPADVNHSHWDCTLSPDEGDDPSGSPALRLGLRLVKGLGPSQGQAISRARAEHGPFQRLEQLQTQAGLAPGAIRALAEADALYSLGFDRRQALWQALALSRDDLPLFDQPQTQPDEPPEDLPQSDELDRVMQDYASMGLTLREHPMSFLRQKLDGRGVLRAADLLDRRRIDPGEALSVAGLVIMRQRPSTAKGVVFITLEDETGIANLVLYKHIFERDLRLANRSRVLRAIGRLQRTETPVEVSTHAVVHLVVDRLISLDGELSELITRSRDYR
jgi:error-prone DNA polymerase